MILVLAGTHDARELALKIKESGYGLITTVVTENAARSMRKAGLPVHTGRLSAEDMAEMIRQHRVWAVVDASHPYAEEASRNAMACAKTAGVPYIRYERESLSYESHENIIMVEDYAGAAEVAAEKRGVIMLTTGSKTLEIFTKRLLGLPDVRLIARMLPRQDNMEKCEALGLEQKNIVAMQGPFSRELNKALFNHYNVTLMITKESGKAGAVDEKVEAALELGIEVVMIARPRLAYERVFCNYREVIAQLNQFKKGGIRHGFSDAF
ncbi:MAG: precorrin-6A reductase [Bacillaceae bacterium]|nr:precorrin-6A reductase [Bacillaceae bacterium]